MSDYTPQQFADKWARTDLKERASYQEHFMDLCRLVGYPTPAEMDPTGTFFTFEAGVKTTTGGQGYADVSYRGHFAIEYKGKGKYDTLDAAYQQLLKYRENLGNPPVLIVCDIEHWEIHTNFTGTESLVHRFRNSDIADVTQVRRWLDWMFNAPYEFNPERTTEEVTKEAAGVFGIIADHMRDVARLHGEPPNDTRIAHFLTKLVFCLFAEDVTLLPLTAAGRGIFTEIIHETREKPKDFRLYTRQLFEAMNRGGKVLLRDIPYFDGTLFADVEVGELSFEALNALEKACRLNWAAVEPSVFGTLFERSLDSTKRAQLGAHYTSRADILLIVEPVLMQPLCREWAAIQQEAQPIRDQYDQAFINGTRADVAHWTNELLALRDQMLDRLRTVTVLDPACGSGNFLYVSLQLLKDLEKEVILYPLWLDLDPREEPKVRPRQLFGIEIDPIAHDLTSIVVWIGYLQWLYNNGYHTTLRKEPILEPLNNIAQMDAILTFDADGNPVEPEWPSVDVIVSNPPFLGAKWMQRELGETYKTALWELYEGRVSGTADLVAYWFEKARAAIANKQAKRVGLLATNTIRQGGSAQTLQRVKETGDIFFAYVDHPWILEGAALRISLIGFDDGTETERGLNGSDVPQITADLTASIDLGGARPLTENTRLSFRGHERGGPFLIEAALAIKLLSERQNAQVVFPWYSGQDLTSRPRQEWVIDFGTRTEDEAQKFQTVFEYLRMEWQREITEAQKDDAKRVAISREKWWLHRRPATDLREAISGLSRFLITPLVSKFRLFVWLDIGTRPDTRLVAFAREDDYFLGVLHSELHEVWSLRLGAQHGGERPTYNNTTCFETFPFPWPPGQEPIGDPAYRAISAAAKQLHEERDAWLNPPGMSDKALQKRTLTNLYNALQVFRGEDSGKVVPEAGDFAPRLDCSVSALDGQKGRIE